MPRKTSFVVLLAILLAIAVVFFQVMANFILPIFLAVLLVVIFGPVHRWFVQRCNGRDRLAAGLTTVAILLVCLLPVLLVFAQAGFEGMAIYERTDVGKAELQKLGNSLETLNERLHLGISADQVQDTVRTKVQEWLGPLVLGTTRYAGRTLLGLAVLIISLYYFLADGPWMVQAVMRLSPLDNRYEKQLVEEFVNISRSVVAAVLVSAAVQGVLAGLGFYLAGVQSVFLLMILTTMLAMVPFVGAAAIWIPVCLWLYFHEGRTLAAVLMAVYGAAVVSTIDNFIKPWILHGRSNLHPLLALLSVIGGVQALGPVGIFVGPMAVVFLHTLLNMVQLEMGTLDGETTAAGSKTA